MADFVTSATIKEAHIAEGREVLDHFHPKPANYTAGQWYGGKWITEYLKDLYRKKRREDQINALHTSDMGVDDTVVD